MSYSPSKYSSTFGVTIGDCQEVFGLSNYSPEEVVDRIFASNPQPLSKDQFRQTFKSAFESKVTAEKRHLTEDCIQKIFDVCTQGTPEVTPSAFGRNISIFTGSKNVSNPVRELFFTLDNNFSGVITETELQSSINVLSDTDLRNKIQSQLVEYKKLLTRNNPSQTFQVTYWDLYVHKNHPFVQSILNAQKQINTDRYSSPEKFNSYISGVNASDYGVTTKTTTTTYTTSSYGGATISPTKVTTTTTTSGYQPTGTTPSKYNDHFPDSYATKPASNISPVQITLPTQGTPSKVTTESGRKPQEVKQPSTHPAFESRASYGQTANVQANRLENRKTKKLASFQDFLQLRLELGFHQLNAKEVILKIRESIGHIHYMSLDEFIMVFVELFRGKFLNYYEFIDRLVQLFHFLDLNNNGSLEIGEVLQAFIHLFGGSEEDKLRAAFHLFDLDNSGFLDSKEVYTLIYNTIKITNDYKGTDSEYTQQQELDLVNVARATTIDVFRTMDINDDSRVSIDEFLTWYRASNGQISVKDLEAAKELRDARLQHLRKRGFVAPHEHDLVVAEQDKIQKDLQSIGAFTHVIDEIRKLVPFEHIHIHTAVDVLVKSFPNRNCNFDEFTCYVRELLKLNKIEGCQEVDKVTHKLFNALDSNKNGILDLAELVTGLSLLCGGNQTEKLKASFDVFDANQDKILDFDETLHFMEAFFKIIKSDNPCLTVANGDAKEYAYALAYKCFEETKTPVEYGLPFNPFKEWVQGYVCN